MQTKPAIKPELDTLRKRVIAVICAYNKKTGVHPSDPVSYAKAMACRTLGFSKDISDANPGLFNSIKSKDLRSVYNTYCKMQRMCENVTKVAAEHATNAYMN